MAIWKTKSPNISRVLGKILIPSIKDDPILESQAKVGVIIMYLSKHFGSLNHELLLAKLKAYGLDNNSLTFMASCLANRRQACKINYCFS